MLIAASFPSAQIRSIALSCTKYVYYRHNQNKKKGFAIFNTSKAFYMISAGFLGLLFRHSFRRNISTFIQLFTKKKKKKFFKLEFFLQGTVWYSMFKWSIVANLTSSLGYTASSLGNHEFDDGVSDLEDFTNAIKDSYPMLACNLDLSQVPRLQPLIKPYILKKISGHTIAIVGYVTPDTKELADSGKVKFIDEIDSLKQTVTKLKKDHGIKIIIAVGHSGYTKDLEIAQKVSKIYL